MLEKSKQADPKTQHRLPQMISVITQYFSFGNWNEVKFVKKRQSTWNLFNWLALISQAADTKHRIEWLEIYHFVEKLQFFQLDSHVIVTVNAVDVVHISHEILMLKELKIAIKSMQFHMENYHNLRPHNCDNSEWIKTKNKKQKTKNNSNN